MNFSEIIQKVNSDKRLVPDLAKAEKGNNFRAISESAILDVIDPVLSDACIFYTTEIKDYHLDIREAYGAKGKKLQFIATLSLKVNFYSDENEEFICASEAVGMGIDDNDKAMGKAYTYALKYALLKLFRLRYGDDPDAKVSEALYADKLKEKPEPEEKKKAKPKNTDEPAMTEKQRDYILGMMDKKGISVQNIISKFEFDPKFDEYIPMKIARAIIAFLEEQDDLPF